MPDSRKQVHGGHECWFSFLKITTVLHIEFVLDQCIWFQTEYCWHLSLSERLIIYKPLVESFIPFNEKVNFIKYVNT